MKLTDLFVRRPVLAIVVNLVILIAGLWSIRSLSVRQYPRSDVAVIRVTTAYVGASADLVRGFITTPLERVIASADGIDYMESSSAQGLSTITVHLALNYDTNAALTQIQAKVAQVRNDLPPEAEAPVIEMETADNQFAAIYLGFASDELDQNQITDYLTRVVQPRLSAIAGVQRADILGDRTFAMRIWLKPDQMAALGISPSDVRDALARNNYLSALGKTKGSMVSVNLVANTDLRTADEFRQLVVKEKDAVVVRLGEIADVVLGAANYDTDVRFNGQTATFMGVWVLPSANSLDVVAHVRDAMRDIRAQLPPGMKAGIPYDSTLYIHDAIDEVLKTLTETLLIVVAVIFLFLGSVRAVLIPVVAIPISLVGAVFLMLAAGFTINLLTLLAIVLAVGLVVDDAIVMVENVERHLHEGQPPLVAAKAAARELVGPIVAMTITLAAVYTPVGIQGGLTGALATPSVGSPASSTGGSTASAPATPAPSRGRSPTVPSSSPCGRSWSSSRCPSTSSRRRSSLPSRTRASSSATCRPPPTRRSTRRSCSRRRSRRSTSPSRRRRPPSRSRCRRAASGGWSPSPGASGRGRPSSS
jgi:multidrug efflux pump